MRAIVTGATGFLGSHLTARLANEGHQVHVLVRPDSNLAPLKGVSSSVTVHVIDAMGDSLDKIVAQSDADIAFHLATYFVPEHTAQDVAPLIDTNIIFPCRLVDAMVRHGIRRLVNCSSAWQHYKGEDYNPVCLYAATKQAFLSVLKYYVEASGLSVADLTISDTYGPDDRRPKLFSTLYRAAASSEPLGFSPGEQLLDLVYVDDVIAAIMIASAQLCESAHAGLTEYTVRGQQPLRLKDLVSTFANVTGLRPNIAWGARPYRNREMMTPWLGGKKLPGWEPTVGIEEGIRKLHESHVRHSKD
jgi:nucleoside-diphosphate-sugar epimerase